VALQALTSYSLTSAPDLSITVASGTSTTSFSVDLNNYVVVQRQQVDVHFLFTISPQTLNCR